MYIIWLDYGFIAQITLREKYSEFVSLCIQSEYGKKRSRKTPNTDTFLTV